MPAASRGNCKARIRCANVFVVVSLNLLDPVLDAMEEPQAQPLARARRDGIELLNPHPESLAEIATEYPQLQWRYEQFREADAGSRLHRPPSRAIGHVSRRRERSRGQLRRAHRALAAPPVGALLPQPRARGQRAFRGLFDMTVAARGIVGDNYAWEVWEFAGRYPPSNRRKASCPPCAFPAKRCGATRAKIRLRRRLPSSKRRLRPYGLKPRKKEKVPGEWASQLNGASICSYPPEDLVVEDYGRYLKKKGKSMLSEERVRVEPFTTSHSRRHRHARDHSQVVRGPDLRPAIPEDSRRSGLGGGDLRRGPRQPLHLYDYVAGRESERIGHGVLFDVPLR